MRGSALVLFAVVSASAPAVARVFSSEGMLAIRCAKALCVPYEGIQVIDHAVLIIEDGHILAVGPAATTPIPAGARILDVGDRWIMPGMVGLHSHIAGPSFFGGNDLNDMVYLTNPGLRASSVVLPDNSALRKAVGGGVTTVLFIPGSGTNMGGQGVLVKTGFDTYEKMELRNPGSLKLAQAGNPERFLGGVRRTFMNWNTRNTFKRGIAYAKRWEAFRAGKGEKPDRDPQWEIFRSLYEGEAQVSTHTQIYQVVLMTITMVREELGLGVFIDHGTFDGFRAAGRAWEMGVGAILGPRGILPPYPGWIDTDGKIQGVAAGYQEAGHQDIGFNTDAPIVPQEELSLQAAVGARFGMTTDHLEAVRGLTIIPAMTAGIGAEVGSLEPGKAADILVVTGDPADPRTRVEMVFIDGEKVYDPATEPRRW
jgi:imidazolonepropionase-like amidohydrolase